MKKIINHLRENWIKYGFETFVITVGILGAFALNNWNEERKIKKEAIEILNKIKQDLEATRFDVNVDIIRHGDCLIAANRIYSFLNSDDDYYDSLDLFFEQITFDYTIQYSDIGYRSLGSFGFEIIKNKELLLDLTSFFDKHLQYVKRIDEGKFWDLLFPYYSKNFEIGKSQLESLGKTSGLPHRSIVDGGFTPLDTKNIKSDPQLKILIREVIYERSVRVDLYKNESLSSIENLMIGIDTEILKLQ